jgi:hypothetical protein
MSSEKLLDAGAAVFDIPVELAALIFKEVGLKLALSSLPANSKLHRAWQSALCTVQIDARTLCE